MRKPWIWCLGASSLVLLLACGQMETPEETVDSGMGNVVDSGMGNMVDSGGMGDVDAGGGGNEDGGGEVDDIAPETSWIETPEGLTAAPSFAFSFASSEAGSSFLCSLNGERPAPCASPHQVSVDDGVHMFAVYAVDPAGNQDPTPAEHMWEVDTTKPETTLAVMPPAFDNSVEARFEFWSSEQEVSFECKLDQGAYAACTSPYQTEALSEGGHSFAVRARDAAGNLEATPAAHAWTVDLSIPDTVIVSGPAGPVSSAAALFSFDSPTGVAFECQLGGSGFQPCTSPLGYDDLAEGCYELQVRAFNQAGSVDPTPTVRAWCVDLTPPVTSVLSGPAAFSRSTSARFEFEASEPDTTFTCRVGHGPGNDDGDGVACSSPFILNDLDQGAHTLVVQAMDAAGNRELAPEVHAWTVDTVAPNTAVSNGPTGCAGSTSVSFTLLSSEPGATFECRRDGQSFAACASPKAYTGLTQGQHSFEVRARDMAGNLDGSPAAQTWTVDTVAPNTTLSSGPSGTETSTTATFGFGSNESGVSFECKLDSGSYAACTSTKRYTGLGQGQHTFRVRARDCAGNVGGSVSRTWTVDTVDPTTTITSRPPTTTTLRSASFSFSASESGSSFRCRLDDGSFSACTSPKSYSSLSLGQHRFEVRATDAAGNVGPTKAATWTIILDDICPYGREPGTAVQYPCGPCGPGTPYDCP